MEKMTGKNAIKWKIIVVENKYFPQFRHVCGNQVYSEVEGKKRY